MHDIQWFPGHMTKTKRELVELLPKVDVVIEVRDARAPLSSANPLLDELCGAKPRVVVLNKMDLADSVKTTAWVKQLRHLGEALPFDATQANGRHALVAACGRAVKARFPNRNVTGINALVAGIPNVGKSLIINQLRGKTVVKAANRPGVTRGLTWIKVDDFFRVADTPGVLWPKFESQEVGLTLAAIGAIKDDRLDPELLAEWVIQFLNRRYPKALEARYKLDSTVQLSDMLGAIAKKRGVIVAGAQPDIERMAAILISEFRVGKLGPVTIETVPTSID